MEADIILTDAPDPSDRAVIQAALSIHIAEQVGPAAGGTLAVLVRDPGNGVLIGGLWGRTAWKWLFVEMLFVPAVLRGCGLGTRVMQRAEAEALRRGCRGAWVDTFSPQASAFYERLGYVKFGAIEGFVAGYDRVFLQKRFPTADPEADLP